MNAADKIRDYFRKKWDGICRNGHEKKNHNNKCNYCVATRGFKINEADNKSLSRFKRRKQ